MCTPRGITTVSDKSFEMVCIAKLVSEYIEEITPKSELEKLENQQFSNRQNKTFRQKGRPTKKDRRDIDDFTDKNE